MQQSLSLSSLGYLDGGAAQLIIDAAFKEAVADLDDRGDDEKPRKVEIVVEMKQLDNKLIEAHVTACARIPKRKTASTIARLTRDKQQQSRLSFQSEAPDDPDQRTLDELEGM